MIDVRHGDCREVLKGLADNSVDTCVTDPPYGLSFMGKAWDHAVPGVEYWTEVLRVLKPGAHLVAFAGTRTHHRMACAIEDAGFEIRDMLAWMYGTGFPKSQNHIKPAFEPITLARKPLSEGTVAANVLRWGTGAINVDGCRIETTEDLNGGTYSGVLNGSTAEGWRMANSTREFVQPTGRWPANVLHDGSDEVVGAFPIARSGERPAKRSGMGYHGGAGGTRGDRVVLDNGGSAARFFYSAKASAADRAGSKHPTVKPVSLIAWLCRLITPPGGLVLDLFAGSGTTGAAATNEGFRALLIEQDAEYVDDIRRRFAAPARERLPLFHHEVT